MPIFDVGSPAYQGPTTVGTSSAQRIWSGTNSALVTANSTAITVRDLMIQNTGTAPIVVGGSSVASNANNLATSGIVVPAGALLVLQGWTATTNTTVNDVFAIGFTAQAAGSVGSGASTCVTGLGTLISAV